MRTRLNDLVREAVKNEEGPPFTFLVSFYCAVHTRYTHGLERQWFTEKRGMAALDTGLH